MNRQSAFYGALLVVGAVSVRMPPVSSVAAPDRAALLVQLAELDGVVRYFHPEVVSGRVNWDSLFASRIVAIADPPAGTTSADELRSLFSRIDKGATFIAPAGERGAWAARAGDSAVVVGPGTGRLTLGALRPLVARAAVLVVDLRGRTDAPGDSILAAVAVAGTATAPAMRGVTYDGFAAAGGVTTPRYVIRARRIPGESFSGTARPALRVAFLADERSVLPPVALALRAQGRAFVVTTGAAEVAVKAESYRVALGAWIANIRIGERAGISGARILADTVVSGGERAASVAADFARRTTRTVSLAAGTVDTMEIIPPLPTPKFAQWNSVMPPTGLRLLAAFRLWNTIHHFSPYKHVMGGNWNGALRAALPKVEAARDSTEFAMAIAAFASNLNDSHANGLSTIGYRSIFGPAQPGLAVRFIENQLVVVKLALDTNVARTGLEVGDVIVDVDGERTEDRFRRLSQYYPASTPQSMRRRVSNVILNGPNGSLAKLTVRNGAGGSRVVEVPRSSAVGAGLAGKSRAGTSLFRTLPGNIGYVDLDRISPTSMDSMFAALKDTRAIIFDMRGYPTGAMQFVVPRVAVREPTTAAVFRRLLVSSPDTAQTTVYRFTQTIPPNGSEPKYAGQTVMLIDERAQSAAEQTGLFFRAANGTKFIGSPTTGANGDVTNFWLPGGVNVTFSGHDIRHADETQLQRVGLKPDIPVTPTIAGIRAGRDEVLEAAFKYLGGVGDIPADTGNDRLPPPRQIVNLAASLPREFPADMWNGVSTGARIGLDETIARSGARSGHITVLAAPASGGVNLSQTIRAEEYAGKRVRFTAYIRGVVADSAQESGAVAYLRVFGDKGAVSNATTAIETSGEWVRKEIVFDVPAGAFGLVVGLSLRGTGQAWIDDVALEVVGPDVPLAGTVEMLQNLPSLEQTKEAIRLRPGKLGNVDFERRRAG